MVMIPARSPRLGPCWINARFIVSVSQCKNAAHVELSTGNTLVIWYKLEEEAQLATSQFVAAMSRTPTSDDLLAYPKPEAGEVRRMR